MSAADWKEKGNTFLKNKEYEEALKCYTEAVQADPADHIHYSNRSVCFYNMGNFEKALEDADECIKIKPDWGKGYLRKGMAEMKADKLEESVVSYKKGLELDPNNQQLKDNLQEAEDVSKNPFTKNYSKLFSDPRTVKHMADPTFQNLLQYAMKDQKVLMQLVQTDPRFMDVFAVLTGIDLSSMGMGGGMGGMGGMGGPGGANPQDRKEQMENMKRQREEDEINRKINEENQRKKDIEDKWNALTQEERDEQTNTKEAEVQKLKGNEEFKKGNYEAALAYYDQAIKLNPKDLAFYLNRSGAYHGLKQYEKAIEDASYIVENTYDFQKKARAYGKIAFSYQEMGEYEKAIEHFEKSILENSDPRIKEALRDIQKKKKLEDEEKYKNPELAEEHNNLANEAYKAGKYPDSLKEYNEAIRRNPENPKYYSNRAAVFIKLMEFSSASKDCEKALELDPMFLRAFQRKASCHIMMKEYHKALDAYERGLKLFPEDQEMREGYSKVMNIINTSTPQDDEERVKHAYADPEIQRLVSDPRIQQFFKDLQENPKVANDAMMKDTFIATAFKKLVAAGIIKTK